MDIIRDLTIGAQKYLISDEVLLFIGARQSGKTTILRQLISCIKQNGEMFWFLNLEDPDYRSLLNKSPKNLFNIFSVDLKKRTYIFIDEIQYLSDPSNFLKYIYDEYAGRIKLIVSGSSAFYIDRKFKDSLAGRKKIFYVKTFSFREFLRFKTQIDLSKINSNAISLSEQEKIISLFYEYIIYGGYPRVVLADINEKVDILSELAYSYIKKDIYEASIRQDEVFYKLFKILASQIGNLVNASELANTLRVSKTAIDNYIYIMRKSFHIALIMPFYKNVRKELTKMPKIYFLDLGLRNFFISNFKPIDIREDKGELLKNVVFRQILEHNIPDDIKFWRTIQRQEVDFVVREKEAFEVKINSSNFKKNNYKTFMQNYPEMQLNLVSMEIKNWQLAHINAIYPWQI